MNNNDFIKITLAQDDSSHWYFIPNEKYEEFLNDLDNTDLVDSGEFGIKWIDYASGGSPNTKQLYIKK